MNWLISNKKKNNSNFIMLFFSIGIILLLVGFSYAFFVYNKTGLYTHTITGGKMKVIYDETQGNNITIENAYPRTDEEALTYGLEFEFTITGYNESEKNVYYAIEIDHGEDVADKERFLDTDMKLTLYENDEVVFENQIYDNLDNRDIYYGYFQYGTDSENPTINNYKMRLWINDNVFISDTPENLDTTDKNAYTSDEFANRYANFKVNVKADLTYDDVGYLTYDANGGEFAPEKTSLLTNMVTTKKPVMEGKGFLGWSSNRNATSPEYLAGEYYTGEGQMLYAVYGDTRNVMSDLTAFIDYSSDITEIYFINDTIENIDNRYNTALTETFAYDITLDNQGSVKAWIEINDDGDNLLYIGSEGTIYLSTGYNLFSGYSNAILFDFTNVDTSMVADMTSMFEKCESLNSLDVSNFNTSNVTTMSSMFTDSWINKLNLSNFNTAKVIDMSNMFQSCPAMEELNLSNFDTRNVTNMSGMFKGCGGITVYFGLITTIIGLEHFNTTQVTDMSEMFYGCSSLINLNVSSFTADSLIDAHNMFRDCYDLTELDLSNFNPINVTDFSYMFWRCNSLKTIYCSFDWNYETVISSDYMFDECYDLLGSIEYNDSMIDIGYANPDTGYFTHKLYS